MATGLPNAVPTELLLNAVGEPGMSPLRLEEEVNTALNSGQTYRQVEATLAILLRVGLSKLPLILPGTSEVKRRPRCGFAVRLHITQHVL